MFWQSLLPGHVVFFGKKYSELSSSPFNPELSQLLVFFCNLKDPITIWLFGALYSVFKIRTSKSFANSQCFSDIAKSIKFSMNSFKDWTEKLKKNQLKPVKLPFISKNWAFLETAVFWCFKIKICFLTYWFLAIKRYFLQKHCNFL